MISNSYSQRFKTFDIGNKSQTLAAGHQIRCARYNGAAVVCVCNKRRSKIKAKCKEGGRTGKKDKRETKEQLHMDIALFPCVTQTEKRARLFFFFLLDTGGSCAVGWLSCIFLRSVQWLNAGNHWSQEEEGHIQKKNGENGGRSFWGESEKERKREREKLSDINYIGCERYITPAIYL